MKEKDLLEIVKTQLRASAGWESDEIATDRVAALNYYLQRKRGDEVNGRSQVVAGDVSASVEANLAQITAAFSSDNIIEFDPLGPDDEDQAQLETDAVIHFVMKANPGMQHLKAAIKDALMLRNGVAKVWVESFKQTRTKTFDNVAPEVRDEVAMGMEVLAYDDGSLTVRGTREHMRFRAASVAVENFHYPKDWDEFDLQEVPFCAERHIDSRSDLVRAGFPKAKVAKLNAMAAESRADSYSRNPHKFVPSDTPSGDPSMDKIEWFECYILTDVDGDGIAERRRVSIVWNDAVVLENEPVHLVPYAMGAAMIMPHRVTGISQYDKLRQNQDEHTGLKRALYDNVNTVTKNRVAYLDGKVNVDDVGDGRPNGGIRVRSSSGITDVRQAVMPFAVPDNSPGILQNIEALKRERTELGGAALDMQSNQTVVGGDRMGSQGLDRAFSVMEQLSAMLCSNIADTLLRNLFLLAHAVLRENYTKDVELKRGGKWESARPSKWTVRDRITVKIGMSPGERTRKAAALQQILNTQTQLAGQGMDEVLVGVDGFYKALMDWGRVSEIQNPEQYFIDPQSEQAQAAFKSKAAKVQKDDQMRQALMTQAIGIEQLRVGLDKYRQDSDLQFKYWADVLRSEIAEAQIVGTATTALLSAREKPANVNGTKGPGEKPVSQ